MLDACCLLLAARCRSPLDAWCLKLGPEGPGFILVDGCMLLEAINRRSITNGVLRGVWSTSDYHNRKRPPRKRTRVLAFILTANHHWYQIHQRAFGPMESGSGISPSHNSIPIGSVSKGLIPGSWFNKLISETFGIQVSVFQWLSSRKTDNATIS